MHAAMPPTLLPLAPVRDGVAYSCPVAPNAWLSAEVEKLPVLSVLLLGCPSICDVSAWLIAWLLP